MILDKHRSSCVINADLYIVSELHMYSLMSTGMCFKTCVRQFVFLSFQIEETIYNFEETSRKKIYTFIHDLISN
jgi:hypothetical protein